MKEDKDFIGYRLVPFCIGFAVYLLISIIGGIFYALIALAFAIGAYGNNAGVIASFIMGIPLVLIALFFGIAVWILTAWLLGRWTQEKCRNYKIKREARRETENKIRAQAVRETEQKMKEQADWEAEWQAMKRQKLGAESAGAQEGA